MGEIIDKVKEKAKDTKDKAKNKVSSVSSSLTSTLTQGREFEEGAAKTEIGRKDDPLVEYRRNEPMTPAKIKEHEPTVVKRDPSDQKITEQGQTGTETEEAENNFENVK